MKKLIYVVFNLLMVFNLLLFALVIRYRPGMQKCGVIASPSIDNWVTIHFIEDDKSTTVVRHKVIPFTTKVILVLDDWSWCIFTKEGSYE